jgi:hypothetical protein
MRLHGEAVPEPTTIAEAVEVQARNAANPYLTERALVNCTSRIVRRIAPEIGQVWGLAAEFWRAIRLWASRQCLEVRCREE